MFSYAKKSFSGIWRITQIHQKERKLHASHAVSNLLAKRLYHILKMHGLYINMLRKSSDSNLLKCPQFLPIMITISFYLVYGKYIQ